MPRRSNSFQKLITLLEKQLASGDVIVTESALLPDTLTGDLREVDILIKYAFGVRQVLIGIECRDHQRKADVQWIEQARSKFDVLPIDKRVMVSRCGFTKTAVLRARQWNIEVISLAQAMTVNWAAALTTPRDWTYTRLRVRIVNVRLECTPPAGIAGFSPAKPVRFIHHGIQEAAADFGQRLTLLENVQKGLLSMVEPNRDWTKIAIRFGFPPEACHTPDELGLPWPVKSAEFDLLCRAVRAPIPLQFSMYNQAVVGTHESIVDEAEVTVAMSQTEGSNPRAAARITVDGQTLQCDLTEFFETGGN